MPLRYLWAGPPCQRTVRASVSFRSWSGQLAVRHTGMPLRYLWKGSPCQSADRSPLRHAVMPLRYLWKGFPCQSVDKSPLRHAGMPLRCLWEGFPCQSADRSPLCHARMPLRHLWKGSPCRSRLWEGLGWCSKQRPLWFARAGWGNRKRTAVAGDIFRKPPKKRKRLARQS